VLGKGVQMWMRADESVTDDMRAKLVEKGDKRSVVWLDHEFVFSSVALFRQVCAYSYGGL